MIAYDKKPGQKIHAANPFISGAEAFEMYSSKGLPIEIIEKFCDEMGFVLDREEF
jgi:alanyl-tRNA synthetase